MSEASKARDRATELLASWERCTPEEPHALDNVLGAIAYLLLAISWEMP